MDMKAETLKEATALKTLPPSEIAFQPQVFYKSFSDLLFNTPITLETPHFSTFPLLFHISQLIWKNRELEPDA